MPKSEKLTPQDLKDFRARQPGKYERHPGKVVDGWTQQQAADWIGVTKYTWCRWETGSRPIPRYVERVIENRRLSLGAIIDKVLHTPQSIVEEWGGVIKGQPGTLAKKERKHGRKR